MVRPESAAVTPLSTRKTRLIPPPLIVTPAAGAAIVSVPPPLLSSSWPPVSVIVRGLAKTLGSKLIDWAPVKTLARLTAWRRPRSPAGNSVPSLVVLTTSAGWVWKAPMSGLGESSGKPRWSVVMPLDGDARADGGAAGEQGDGLRRPAVVAQRGQAQVGEAGQDDVAVDPIDQTPRAAGADQVVAARDVGRHRRCRWRRRDWCCRRRWCRSGWPCRNCTGRRRRSWRSCR